ncbi:MAG: ABC transporter permease [Clostridiales bacterium]|nr:ABC transporter permease [Clostridiales bacterium]
MDDFYIINFDNYVLGKKSDTDMGENIIKQENLKSAYKNLFNNKINLFVNYIEDDDFNRLCENNGINSGKYYGGSGKALIMNNINHKKGNDNVFTDKMIGREILPADSDAPKIIISDFVEYEPDNYVCNLNSKNTISVYRPFSECYDKSYANYGIVTKNHEEVANSIYNIFSGNSFENASLSDLMESFETTNAISFVIQVLIYGFIALITLITVANIINTISTGISLRRKEFAMMKSVGITPAGFRKMISLESLFYGLNALILGLPVSVILNYAMYKALTSDVISFSLNPLLYLEVISVVFIIVGLTMIYSVKIISKNSIIETLKEDIC